jgi:hypothetical protein
MFVHGLLVKGGRLVSGGIGPPGGLGNNARFVTIGLCANNAKVPADARAAKTRRRFCRFITTQWFDFLSAVTVPSQALFVGVPDAKRLSRRTNLAFRDLSLGKPSRHAFR